MVLRLVVGETEAGGDCRVRSELVLKIKHAEVQPKHPQGPQPDELVRGLAACLFGGPLKELQPRHVAVARAQIPGPYRPYGVQ